MTLHKLPQSSPEQKIPSWKEDQMLENTFYPLSHGQQALWFLYEMAPDSVAYNIFTAVKICSNLDIPALHRAWQQIVNRHPILRTTYTNYSGRPVQQIHEQKEIPIEVTDASNWSEDYLNKQILLETDRTFNLEKDSVLRVNLFTRSAQEHFLLLTMHHIASDSWSFDLLLNELQILYAAETKQAISQQIEVAEDFLTKNLPYTDFVHWQSSMLTSSRGEEKRKYWQKQLAGELPVLNLPRDRPRPPVQTYRGETHIFKLDEKLIQELKNFALTSGTSLYKILLAAFFVLLYRYTNTEDILVGSPMLNRWGRKFKGIVGYLVNPVVLRASVSGNLTFKDFLAQVSSQVKEAQKHQDYPFPLLVKQLQQERDPSRSPLFQVSFTWQKQRWYHPTKNSSHSLVQELQMEPYPLGHQRGAGFDLDVMVMSVGEVIQVCWQYNTDLFDVDTIARMAGHFQTLLKAIATNPEQQISELPLLTETERHQLLFEWNNTEAEYPQDKSIHQLFEEQVERSPSSVAIVFEGEQLTYRELNVRANQLAHYLKMLGVKPEVLVGICVERSLEMVIGLLGILKAGGAYVPLDPTYPSERLAFMLEDSSVPVLLTQSKLVEKLPTHSACVVCLDSDCEKIAFHSEDNLLIGVKPENLAYVIYTSGSTGKPKGVLILHGSLVNYTTAAIAEYGIEKCDRFLQFSSISFDVSAEEIYTSLTSGATLVLRTDSMLDSVGVFLQKCIDWELTILALPTAYWHELTIFLSQEKFALPPSLRLVIIGGEKALTERLTTWLEYVGQRVRLVDNYGPTEATIGATIYDLSAAKTALTAVPIGRPIRNVQTYILDRSQQPVPIGVPGELYIGGDGLARGYLNRPDLTDEKFIPNPFSNERDSRLYKTGDLARYLPDGNIEFLGRIDNQIKIRGFRIELSEIQTVISQHPSVKETIVIATESIAGNKQLVAYIVCQTEVVPPISDLRNFLKQKLPDYMIPAAFIMLDNLPLTPNGKVDRFALPKPETAYQQLATTFVPPHTSIQKILATIWAEVLQLKQVGIHDNFFELGGDSILSIQIIARCHQANLKLTPKDLFQHQTIASIAQVVSNSGEIQAEQGLVTGIVPLTPIQHWFIEQNLPEPHHFNQSFLFEISPELKPELLQQVLQQLLLHHDGLRLRLIPSCDIWLLINAATEETEIFSTIDLSEIAPTEQIAAIETTATQLQASLNLSDGPIIRVTLFHLGNHQPNRLLIIIHHLAVDGVSWRILLEDLITAYQQLSRGETIQLSAKTTSFKDWAVLLTEYAQSQTAIAELDYWLTQSESKIAPLPVDYPSQTAENKIADTAEVLVSLSVEQTSALLKEVPKAYNTQINDVLLTALVQSFAQWTGQTSLLIDLEGHGREELFELVNLSRTVGWFTSIFPVSLKLEKTVFSGKSLKSIKEQLRRIPKRGIGYGIIRYLSQDETIHHKLQHLPKAQVSFNYLGQFDQMLSAFPILGLAKESSGSPVSLKGSRSHLLSIDGFVADGKLQLTWAYNTKLHQAATIERLASSFIEALTTIISHCLSRDAFGYTPTDFPDADLTQEELDSLVESLIPKTQIESIYPLSPMQEGMLFHTLYAPDSGVYFVQSVFTLGGNLNISAFEQAWHRVVELHPVLRTFFVWKNRQYPLQVVCKSVNLPWNNYDWRSLSEMEQEERLAAFLQGEQERGFELDKAPLMCCTLIGLTDNNYQFVWSHHHLLMDGWCGPIVLKEVWAFYEAFNRGENLYLNAPPPYRNYIAWLRQQDSEAGQKFWRSTLAGFTTPTPLMVDKLVGNLSEQKQIYDRRDIKLSATVTDALKEFARQHHLTLNTLVQGAWALLLSRYSGEPDVVFGGTVSGRPPTFLGVESMVGLFINTLPVRVQISPEIELLSWLKQLQVSQVEREQYSYSPLVEIQGISDVPKNVPLFSNILVFENYPVNSSLLEGKGSVEISNIGGFERTNYPLTVAVVPGKELSIQISYDTNRFDDDTVSRMIGHLQVLLEGMVAHPRKRICELPLLTEREKQQLLLEWNDTQKEYPQDKCIHQLFEEQVELTPNAVAVVFEGEHLTYRKLNAKANQLAHYLQTLGVEPEVLVGICVERSIEMVVGLLAILKAGDAYVPLDPTYPKERLAFMLENAQARVLLTQQQLIESLPLHQTSTICLDSDWEVIAQQSEENPVSFVTPDNLAYVIYTSGSTGKPKGVAMTHRSLSNLIKWQVENSTLSREVRTLQFSPVSFDVSFQEIFSTWCSGGTLVLIRNEVRQDPLQLWRFLTFEAIARIFLPFVALQQLAEVADTQETFPISLREIITAGEQLRISRQIKNLFSKLKNCTLQNQYGPSESHVVTAFTLTGSPSYWPAFPPVGRPITNTQIYILDVYLQPVPIGIPGELYISGDGLARGYLNRPNLTDEKFIPNPFSNKPESRLYKTGDLARYKPDGNIEFLGRIDNQVKIRGFRIELGEIETVLCQHPGLRETAVIAKENVACDKQLIAYVVPHQESAPAITDLRRFLKKQLPNYMVPGAFVLLPALPLTPNGKVDRRALPAPDLRPELEQSFVAPGTPIEEMLASIWIEVMKIERVGVQDNFFELGGHSLLATQVISRVRDTFALELPLRSLFEAPTIAELASSLEKVRWEAQGKQIPFMQRVSRNQDLPLSFAQQRLWFLDQLVPNTSLYNVPAAFRLIGNLNVAALEQSLGEIVKRHEILRTTFAVVERKPVLAIVQAANFTLPVVDLQELLEADVREAKAIELLIVAAGESFNLAVAPLLRCQLFQLKEQEYILLVTMHHIVTDGWSFGVFTRELAALYQAFTTGTTSPLKELPIQYADFAVWQQQWLRGETLECQLAYWKQQLAGVPAVLELPTDRPRPSEQTFQGAIESFSLPKSLSKALEALSHKQSATLFMTLLAVFKTLLYRYTGQDNIVVGSPIANRHWAEIEGLIGFFVNTLVLRTYLGGNPSFEELLGRVREVALQAYAHQDVPFEQLVEALQPDRSLSHTPLFQVMFVLQNAPASSVDMPDLTVSPLAVETRTAKFDLTLSMENTADGLIGVWEYNTDLFDETTIARMAGHFQTLLEAIATNPKQQISELPLLTQAERHKLLVEWNNTFGEYPQDKCIHQLFEAQVEQQPDAIALVKENQQLTYRELNRRANQLAYYLRSLGVGPEVLIGICVERSFDMIVGILGVLKAGGAYIPLDPAYPQERLAFMLEDSSVAVLLTQAQLVEKLPQHQSRVVCLDGDWENIARHSSENSSSTVTPDNLAYVIYTSGSTGKPKGVLLAHRGLCNLTTAQIQLFDVQPNSRILQFASFSFDASVCEVFMALVSGAILVLAKQDSLMPGTALIGLLRDEAITTVTLPPSVLAVLTNEEFPALRTIIVAGEACNADLVARWSLRRQFFNAYGPTEATVCATVALCRDPSYKPPIGRPIANTKIYILDTQNQPVPIGVPGELHIGGVGLAKGYLNRPDLTFSKFIPNPFSDEPGSRLYKTGDLARYLPDGNIEYLGRIDNQVKVRGFRIELGEIEAVLTQHPQVREAAVIVREDIPGNKRLVAYVVSNLIPERIPYYSECQLELDGNTIQLHTEDISIGGVVLVGVPPISVCQCVRLHLQLPSESELRWLSGIVGWSRPPHAGIQFQLTPSELALVDQSVSHLLETQGLWISLQRTMQGNLRDYLKQKLPDYMIPSAFILMKALPLTPNGKVDRRALPTLLRFYKELENKFVAPRTPTEAKLAAIWVEVLGLQQVSINDNFFELGGHSLLATQIISRLRQAFSIEVPLRLLFEAPTIASVSKTIETACTTALQEQSSSRAASNSLTPLAPVTQDGHITLSLAQEYIWYIQQLDPDSCICNSGVALRFTEKLSSFVLERSINEIIRRHEILRTTFPIVEGQPVQAIAKELTLTLKIVDLQDLPPTAREAKALHVSELEMNQYHFDLEGGPLIKTTLMRLAPQEHWLLIPMHHMITDGYSADIFVQELKILYQAFSNGLPSPLPEVPLQYADFTLWQRQRFNEGVLEKQLNYWLQKLVAPLQQLESLRAKEPKPNLNSRRASIYSLVLRENQVASLENLSRSQNVTISAIIIAALSLLLFKWSGQSEILVAVTIGNRITQEIEKMLGCFINDVILRSQLDDEQTGVALLEQVKETLSEAIGNKDIPLQKVMKAVRSKRELTISACVVMQPLILDSDQMPEWELAPVMPKYDEELWDGAIPLELYTFLPSKNSQTIEIEVIYSTEKFDRETIENLFSYYQEILHKLAEFPEINIAAFERFQEKNREGA